MATPGSSGLSGSLAAIRSAYSGDIQDAEISGRDQAPGIPVPGRRNQHSRPGAGNWRLSPGRVGGDPGAWRAPGTRLPAPGPGIPGPVFPRTVAPTWHPRYRAPGGYPMDIFGQGAIL